MWCWRKSVKSLTSWTYQVTQKSTIFFMSLNLNEMLAKLLFSLIFHYWTLIGWLLRNLYKFWTGGYNIQVMWLVLRCWFVGVTTFLKTPLERIGIHFIKSFLNFILKDNDCNTRNFYKRVKILISSIVQKFRVNSWIMN